VLQPETMQVPDALLGRNPCYVLQVSSDSMIDEGILDGDYVVTEQHRPPSVLSSRYRQQQGGTAPQPTPMNTFDFNFQQIVDAARDIVIVTKADPIDPPGPEIVYVNKAFTELTGYTAEEVIGKTPRLLQASGTDADTKKTIKQALQNHQPVRVTIKNYSKSGREYWLDVSILALRNEAGEATHFVAIERDVTEQKELEHKLETLSRTDPLTGLLNRRSLEDYLAKEYSRFKRHGTKFSALMLDVDHFKSINDKYGHSTGDGVLKMLADSCTVKLRRYDVMARYGGEEFCMILPYTDGEHAAVLADKLRTAIAAKALQAGDSAVRVTASIGVSEVQASDKTPGDILERADAALYEAKRSGRDRVCLSRTPQAPQHAGQG
jgi:diguanylate cyclase (GGDEF)-like protein/PAS domain S-box-containing protein